MRKVHVLRFALDVAVSGTVLRRFLDAPDVPVLTVAWGREVDLRALTETRLAEERRRALEAAGA